VRVSAIIPAFNCARYLPDAIRSVLDQSRGVHELIVVDDGSTDNTGDVVRGFSRVTYVRTPNQGAAAARNVGLARATGDLVAFLDADDAWYPNKLALQVEVLASHADVHAVCCDFSLVSEDGTLREERHIRRKYRVFSAYGLDWPAMFPARGTVASGGSSVNVYFGDAFAALFRGNFVNTSSIVLRRDAIERAGRFTVGRRTQEDYELWLKIALGGAMAYIDLPLLTFRRRPNQLTSDDQRLRVVQDTAEVVAALAGPARSRVGEAVVDERVADLYYTLAKALLGSRQSSAARSALGRAYAHSGFAPRVASLYAWSWMPASLGDGIRRGYKRMRQRAS
jgi:glycosyltransferase involved in cell wall biosynthesis